MPAGKTKYKRQWSARWAPSHEVAATMQQSCIVVIIAAVTWQALVASAGPEHSTQDVPDTFKIFKDFPNPIAIMNSNNDTKFECLTAKRVSLDMTAKTSEYIWLFKGHGNNPKETVAFYVLEGTSPDKFFYMVNSDDAPKEEGHFYYTDYKNCAILYMPFSGGQCTLWAKPAKRDSLPQECIEQFTKVCGDGAPTYSRELCPEEELALY